MKKLLVAVAAIAVVTLWAGVAAAGEYHAGSTLLCYDCHTIHFSMAHQYGSGAAVTTTPAIGGNWLPAAGPNAYLLKGGAATGTSSATNVCLACHDGQTFAPDVWGANTNAAPTNGRGAGELPTGTAPYDSWKGHYLSSTATPPGWNPTAVGLSATWYNAGAGLGCTSCHSPHGNTAFRNLGPDALGGTVANFRPTYVISNTNNTSQDVWVNLAAYTAGSGAAATFNPFYSTASIRYNRNDATVSSRATSNKLSTLCAACHADLHGASPNTNIGGSGSPPRAFQRHPTAQTNIGALNPTTDNVSSLLSQYVGKTNKVPVVTNDYSAFSNSTPFCLSCHKAHGNQNPFGLIFMASTGAVSEEGTGTTLATGIRDLCGQCHVQGNL